MTKLNEAFNNGAGLLSEDRTDTLLKHIEIMSQERFGERKWLFDVEEIKQLLETNKILLKALKEESKDPQIIQSNIRDHAVRELALLTSDASATEGPDAIMDEYEKSVHSGVMDLLEVFIDQGHSGMSAQWTLSIFEKLARFDNLTPLTDNPSDWNEVVDGLWQNRRNGSCFSIDEGKTYYNVNGGRSWWGKFIPKPVLRKMPKGARTRAMYKHMKAQPATVRRSS